VSEGRLDVDRIKKAIPTVSILRAVASLTPRYVEKRTRSPIAPLFQEALPFTYGKVKCPLNTNR